MRRRRQKNTLLPKMLGVATVIVAILLPLLAQLGVFKVARQRLQPVTLVKLPPPEKRPPVKKKTPPKKRVAKAKPRPSGRRAARPAVAARPNPNQPKVVASSGGGSGSGPTIDNSGTATPGQVAVPIPPVPEKTPPVSPSVTPPSPAAPPAAIPPALPAPTPPPAPRIPVLTPAVAVSQPRPVLPDDLRDQELHGTFRAVFAVHADGTADVKMASSTGNAALDSLALATARRWTFRPATRDGSPVDSFLRLTIEFEVT